MCNEKFDIFFYARDQFEFYAFYQLLLLDKNSKQMHRNFVLAAVVEQSIWWALEQFDCKAVEERRIKLSE